MLCDKSYKNYLNNKLIQFEIGTTSLKRLSSLMERTAAGRRKINSKSGKPFWGITFSTVAIYYRFYQKNYS